MMVMNAYVFHSIKSKKEVYDAYHHAGRLVQKTRTNE